MQRLFDSAHASGKVVYFDKGAYLVTYTVNVYADQNITV